MTSSLLMPRQFITIYSTHPSRIGQGIPPRVLRSLLGCQIFFLLRLINTTLNISMESSRQNMSMRPIFLPIKWWHPPPVKNIHINGWYNFFKISRPLKEATKDPYNNYFLLVQNVFYVKFYLIRKSQLIIGGNVTGASDRYAWYGEFNINTTRKYFFLEQINNLDADAAFLGIATFMESLLTHYPHHQYLPTLLFIYYEGHDFSSVRYIYGLNTSM